MAVLLCRFEAPGRGPSLGVLAAPGPEAPVADLGPEAAGGAVAWLRRALQDGGEELRRAAAAAPRAGTLGELEALGLLLPPVAAPEVWAAGVTYERSRDARDRETAAGAPGETPYDRVYAAERPELFLKATSWRLAGPGRPVGLRGDSRWLVPEPELALVLDADGTLLGHTLGNDLSARDIEGENPLYLPQAKIFRGSCSLGPALLPAGLAEGRAAAAEGFAIGCTVRRRGEVAWTATGHTRQMRRRPEELVAFLLRYNWLQPGTALLCGTALVPPDDFCLAPGDEIEIGCPALGLLRNVAVPA
jgi:2-dehydro-3-deoxy-D-arabinonate dehydratase